MKGPYERLKYDLRRVFECPRCHHRVKFAGSATSVLCDCVGTTPEDQSPAVMDLVEDGVRRVDGRSLPARGSAVVPAVVPSVAPAVAPAVAPEVTEP